MTGYIALILLILIVLFAVGSYIGFYIAFARGLENRKNRKPMTDSWKEYMEPIEKGRAWIYAQKPEEVHIAGIDGADLVAHYIPCPGSKKLIIMFHGYRSKNFTDFSCAAEYFHSIGLGMLIVTQRAHGDSEGKYICFGSKERYDCVDWARYAYNRFGSETEIYLDGMSMGAATVLMAANLPLPPTVRGIIADCGYTRPWDIIGRTMNQLHIPKYPLLWGMEFICRTKGFSMLDCSAAESLRHTNIPVLFIHGEADTFVPVEMTYENHKACISKKQLVTVKNADHGVSFLVDETACKKALEDFILNT